MRTAKISGPVNSSSVIEMCEARYIWKEVNYSLFLYDRQEDVYIPEQVYWELVSGLQNTAHSQPSGGA